MKQDQSKVEDMLSSNRQSKVEEDFGRFVDEARVDVLDRIRTLCHPKEKIYMEIYCPRLACLLFEVHVVIYTSRVYSCRYDTSYDLS